MYLVDRSNYGRNNRYYSNFNYCSGNNTNVINGVRVEGSESSSEGSTESDSSHQRPLRHLPFY